MQNSLPKLIVIVGPTASGKTDLAIKLAKYLSNPSRISSNKTRICDKNSRDIRYNSRNIRACGAEIVSADSRQVYKGMDIGTAKPTRDRPNITRIKTNVKRMRIFDKHSVSFAYYSSEVAHYLINIKNPDENYTVAEFKKDAIDAINKIIKRGKVPILAGGTGLYVKAVTENLKIPSVKPNPALRRKLEKRIEKEGLEALYRELIEQDPEAAYIVDGKNPRRVIRALEIAIITKKPFSSQRKKGKKLFDTLKIGIKLPDAELKKRIEKRADGMIKNGLVDEVKKLVKKYGERQIAFDAIGYREIIHYLAADQRGLNTDLRGQNKLQRRSAPAPLDSFASNGVNLRQSARNLKEVVDMIKKNTWSFAKRQMTWFRGDKEIKWVKKEGEAFRLAKNFFSK